MPANRHAIRFHAAFCAALPIHPPVASSSHLTVLVPLFPLSLSARRLCLARCRAHISLSSQLAVNTKYNCLTVHKNEEIKDPFVCVHRVSIELRAELRSQLKERSLSSQDK